MAKKLTDIEGIGPSYAQKLKETGIGSVEKLLKKGSAPKDRQELAQSTGLSSKLILRWINCADLFRIKGIGGQYAELLEAAGVDTVPELAQRNAKNLYQKMVAVNAEKKLVRQIPSARQIESWVDQAKLLPRVVNY